MLKTKLFWCKEWYKLLTQFIWSIMSSSSIMAHIGHEWWHYECTYREVYRRWEDADVWDWLSSCRKQRKPQKGSDAQSLLNKTPRLFHHHWEISFDECKSFFPVIERISHNWSLFVYHIKRELYLYHIIIKYNLKLNYYNLVICGSPCIFLVYCANNKFEADKSFKWKL